MADDREFLGHAVENGVLRFLSVSATEKADPLSDGCYKRWANRYVFGFKEDESEQSAEAKEKGIGLHARIAEYEKTGKMVLDPLEQKGLHFIPTPGPDLWVEQPFHRVEGTKISSSLYAAGVPFIGYIDLGHGRLTNKGGEEGPDYRDPVGTYEVIDWKRKGNAKDRNGGLTYKQAFQLVRTVQMAGYGRVVANTQPSASYVRLSHGYFFEKGEQPKKVTKLHVIDDALETWNRVESVARSLKDIARETDINKVPGNLLACDTYGGCPYREARKDLNGGIIRPACSSYTQHKLDVLYGGVTKDWNKPMPLMSQVLANEENAARAQQTQIQNQTVQPGLLETYTKIAQYGRGTPALAGNAAQEYARAGGQSIAPGTTFQGSGQLGQIVLSEVAHIYQLAGELAGQQPTAPTPPPPQAYQPGMMTTQQAIAQMPLAAQPSNNANFGALPPDAPASMPQLAMQHTAPVSPVPTAPSAAQSFQAGQNATASDVPLTAPPAEGEQKKGRGRPEKNDSTPAQTQPGPTSNVATPTAAQPPLSTPTVGSAPQVSAPAQGSLSTPHPALPPDACILINARFVGKDTKSLAPYVDYINRELAKKYNVTADGRPGVLDVRCAVKDSVLAFGGWKGAVHQAVQADPPQDDLYHLDTHLDDLNEVVADALRIVAANKGWTYVRGVR